MDADVWKGLIPALSGALGAILVAVLAARHERAQQLVERCLRTADEFASEVLNTLVRFEEITEQLGNHWTVLRGNQKGEAVFPLGHLPTEEEVASGSLSQAREAESTLRKANTALVRVNLLFHPDSAVAGIANGIVGELMAVQKQYAVMYQLVMLEAQSDAPILNDQLIPNMQHRNSEQCHNAREDVFAGCLEGDA